MHLFIDHLKPDVVKMGKKGSKENGMSWSNFKPLSAAFLIFLYLVVYKFKSTTFKFCY